VPVNWTGDGTEFILLTSSPGVFGLWDMHGHYVMDLKELELFEEVPVEKRKAGVCPPMNIVGDPRDELAVQYNGKLFMFTQDRPCEGERIYAPIRNERIIYPASSFERWMDCAQD